MANRPQGSGTASDMNGIRQAGPAQDSKLAKLNYQELLETRLLSTSGVTHPIKHASLFDRDDNQRVATTDKSFELPTEEIVDIQDRIIAVNTPVGASKGPIKVQGKEYKLKDVNVDTLTAEADGTTVIAAVTASLVLVFTTESDQVDALVTLARNFSEGLSNQAV